MTALLSCDGCGTIVSSRPDDDDPTADWWSLAQGPSIGGEMLFPTLEITESYDDAPVLDDDDDGPEPMRHFCSDRCGELWFARRRRGADAEVPD